MCKVKDASQLTTLAEVAIHFSSHQRCLEHIEKWLWKGKVSCPECCNEKIYRCNGGKVLKCSKCKRRFSMLTGTIFENTQLSLDKWFMAIFLICNNKKGISSRQLAAHIGVTQSTAWFLSHRIRSAFGQSKEKMKGIVCMDETFVGGANGNRHIDKKVKNKKDRTFIDKHTVHGMIDCDGKLRCTAIKSTKVWHLQPSVKRNVEQGTLIVTDEWPSYKGLGMNYGGDYPHYVVNHKKRKFVSPEGASTNTVENAWSHLKRMFYGTYNFVTKKHVQKYLDEYVYRFNSRDLTQGERFAMVFSSSNTPLPYKTLVHGKKEKTIRSKDNREGGLGNRNAFA